MASNLPRLELTNTLEPNRSSLASWGVYGSAVLEQDHYLDLAEITKGGLGGDGPCLWSQPFWGPAETSSKAQGGVQRGEGEGHRWYGRERCRTAIVGIIRWWERENNFIGELSSEPEMTLGWRRRFQGAATAAVYYVQQ